jgi:hypothetical protein
MTLRVPLPRAAVVLAASLALSLACNPGPKSSTKANAPPRPTPVGTPIGAPGSTVIGAAGGSMEVAGGLVTVTVPAGAVSGATGFTAQEITNFAPGGVGGAYRLGPEGSRFTTPVTLTFSASQSTHDLDDLAVAYQDASGYWVRPWNVVRNRTAGTLSVTTTHFSDWTLVTTPSSLDLHGSFQLTQNYDNTVPFSALGDATLNYAGENAYETFYLLPGTVTLTGASYGAFTCTPTGSASVDLPVQLAELIKSPAHLDWGIPAAWDLSCTDGTTTHATDAVSAFDTLGAYGTLGCQRTLDPTSFAGTARVKGSYTIDCGTRGTVTASWDFQSAACGTPCTSPTLCHSGVWSCTTGNAVCVDAGPDPTLNGTTCGTNAVCYNGTCNPCTAGVACSPGNVCDAGLTSCSTGQQTCVDTAQPDPAVNGTTCGTNQVCFNGACNTCLANVACTPGNVCDAGLTSCATGQSTCVDAGADPAVNGTTCGTDQVCFNGTCGTCLANVTCTPTNVCDKGATSCASGQSACVDGGPDPSVNGTTCGTDQVCFDGACNTCLANVACTPANVCDKGATSCATGQSACVDGGPDPSVNGTTCGTDQVCFDGACNTCLANVACTPANVCDKGATSCATGQSACVDAGPDPSVNGTTCGTDQVCFDGACGTCVANLSCTPANSCDKGVTSCSTGQSTCVDAGPDPSVNGSTCGSGMSCNAGACVTSATVTGTRRTTFWPDDPAALTSVVSADVAGASLSAVVPDGKGGVVSYAGTFTPADGSFSIPNVPTGAYLLVMRDASGFVRGVQTAASTVDLGFDLAGRPDGAYPGASTPVVLDLSLGGLDAWIAGDQLEIASSNASLWDVLDATTLAAGATAGTLSDDWFASAAGVPMRLLAPADVLTVYQLHSAQGPGTTNTYLAATQAASTNGLLLTSGPGNPAVPFPVLTPPAATGSILVDWNLAAFEQYVGAVNPGATAAAARHALMVGASPHQLSAPAPVLDHSGTPTLFLMQAAGGSAPAITFVDPSLVPTTVSYGRALDPTLWQEWRGVQLTVDLGYTAPGATTAATLEASIGQREAMSPAPPTPIAPLLSPPTAPILNGASAFTAATGVGTTPTLSWSAPASGTATSYTVDLFALTVAGTATVATPVASFSTAGTQLQVPPNVLASGTTYVARVTAVAASFDPSRPFRTANVYAWAGLLTATFAP